MNNEFSPLFWNGNSFEINFGHFHGVYVFVIFIFQSVAHFFLEPREKYYLNILLFSHAYKIWSLFSGPDGFFSRVYLITSNLILFRGHTVFEKIKKNEKFMPNC